MSNQDPIVIVGAARTPMGAFQGAFSELAAHDLGGAAIRAAVERAGVAPEKVDEVLFGNCLMAGQGQAPARQAGFKGGLPRSTGAVTLSRPGAGSSIWFAGAAAIGPGPFSGPGPFASKAPAGLPASRSGKCLRRLFLCLKTG